LIFVRFYSEKNGESRTFWGAVLRFFAPQIEIKQSKRPKKSNNQSHFAIPLSHPTSENKSKQSKSRDNPGEYSTLHSHVVARHEPRSVAGGPP
jgi:hypothetical protein